MPLIAPGTAAIVFVIAGIGGVATFSAFKVARKLGPGLEPEDFLPAMPPRLPLPRFVYDKPELLQELKRK